jgi:hypothetical protein
MCPALKEWFFALKGRKAWLMLWMRSTSQLSENAATKAIDIGKFFILLAIVFTYMPAWAAGDSLPSMWNSNRSGDKQRRSDSFGIDRRRAAVHRSEV